MRKMCTWTDDHSEFLIENYNRYTTVQLADLLGCSTGTIANKARLLNLSRPRLDSLGKTAESVVKKAKKQSWGDLAKELDAPSSYVEDIYLRYGGVPDLTCDYFETLDFDKLGGCASTSTFLTNYVDLACSIYISAAEDLRKSIKHLAEVVDRGDCGGSLELAVKRVLFDESAFFTDLYKATSDIDGKKIVSNCWNSVKLNRDIYLKPYLHLIEKETTIDE